MNDSKSPDRETITAVKGALAETDLDDLAEAGSILAAFGFSDLAQSVRIARRSIHEVREIVRDVEDAEDTDEFLDADAAGAIDPQTIWDEVLRDLGIDSEGVRGLAGKTDHPNIGGSSDERSGQGL